MPDPWLYLPWHVAGGAFHMGLDAAMLESPPERPVLRLYGWHAGGLEESVGQPGCISLGRFQRNLPDDLLDHLQPFGLTRRSTGGGAIYHWGEITYTIVGTLASLRLATHESIAKLGEPAPATGRPAAYARFHTAWIAALAEVGGFARSRLWMPAQRREPGLNEGPERFFCFTRRTGYDVLTDLTGIQAAPTPHPILSGPAIATMPEMRPTTGKVIGSAQRFRHDVLLQHGSIKVARSPLTAWEVSIADLASPGRLPDMDVDHPGALVSEPLAHSFAAALGVRFERWELPPRQRERAIELARSRYANDNWVRRGRRE